nr:MAG TPA: hypothetical protein [Caudoviricetes sp.]
MQKPPRRVIPLGWLFFIALVYPKVYTIVATFSRRFINNGGYTTEMG